MVKSNREEEECHFSEELIFAGHRWRMMLMNRSHLPSSSGGESQQCLSVYVDLVDAHSFLPEHVGLAHLAITLMNRDPARSTRKVIGHPFTSVEYARGFIQLVTTEDAFNQVQGWGHAVTNSGDCLVVEGQVKIVLPTYRSASTPMECPRTHGFCAGLKAPQGALNCRLNTVLQILFPLSAFRKQVYALPTGDDGCTGPAARRKSAALALQRVFGRMQLSEEPIGTEELREALLDGDQGHHGLSRNTRGLVRLLGDCLAYQPNAPEPQGMFHRLFGRKTWAAIEDHTAPPEILGDKPFSEFRLTVRGCVNVQSLDLGVLPPLGAPNPRYEAGG